MHAAHGVGHTVGCGAGGHVVGMQGAFVGMQGASGTAAGSYREVLLAHKGAFLLVGSCNGVLEAGRVGGVSGNGDVHALEVHDSHALAYVVGAVAAYSAAYSVRVLGLADDVHLAGGVVELGLHVGEAVDAGDDLGGVLSEAVENHAEGLLAHLVGHFGDLDRSLGRGV